MIKNRTSQFKQKYSNSQPKHQKPRDSTPDYVKDKFYVTGFTDFSVTTSAKQKSTRRLAKVQSTAFIKSRTKLSELCHQAEFYSKKYLDNSTSLCQYLNQKSKRIENQPLSHFKQPTNEEAISQKATSNSNNFFRKTKQSPPKSQIIVQELSNIEEFFNSLTPRSLFFCSKCFRYSFAIEKNLHHPKCENQLDLNDLKPKQKQAKGWERIQLILELSQYTNFKQKQISELYKKLKDQQLGSFQNVFIDPNVSFLSLEQIIAAFAFTYEILLKKQNKNSSRIFSMKKIFSCVEPKNSSILFEKKLYG